MQTFNINYYERIRKNHIQPLNLAFRKYALFPNDNAVTSSLIDGWVYEPYMFEFISYNMLELEGTTIIDAGANNGHFAVEFAHYVSNSGKVYCFEPQRIIYQQLCANVFLNGLDNVYAFNNALGDKESIGKIEKPDYFKNDYVNFGDVHVNIEGGEDVYIKTIDSFELDNVSLIKIDTQGFEPLILKGAEKTIAKNRPYMFIEIEPDQLEKYGYNNEELIKQIENLNYVVKQFHVGIQYQSTTGFCIDFVCIPKEKYETNNYIIP